MNSHEDLFLQKLSKLTVQQATIYSTMAKKTSTAIVCALFFGGIGGHYFYMGRTRAGIMSVLFFWTLIPSLLALIFMCKAKWIIRDYNSQLATNIIGNSLLMQSPTS